MREQATVCILDGARGRYLPRDFANSFAVKPNKYGSATSLHAAMEIVSCGEPDGVDDVAVFDDCWQEILDDGVLVWGDLAGWTLWQDGDLFAVHPSAVWCHRCEWYAMAECGHMAECGR